MRMSLSVYMSYDEEGDIETVSVNTDIEGDTEEEMEFLNELQKESVKDISSYLNDEDDDELFSPRVFFGVINLSTPKPENNEGETDTPPDSQELKPDTELAAAVQETPVQEEEQPGVTDTAETSVEPKPDVS